MAWFIKPKNPEAVAPQPCHRCGKRLGTVHIRMLWRSAGEKATGRGSDWWLCADCAQVLRRNAPPSS